MASTREWTESEQRRTGLAGGDGALEIEPAGREWAVCLAQPADLRLLWDSVLVQRDTRRNTAAAAAAAAAAA